MWHDPNSEDEPKVSKAAYSAAGYLGAIQTFVIIYIIGFVFLFLSELLKTASLSRGLAGAFLVLLAGPLVGLMWLIGCLFCGYAPSGKKTYLGLGLTAILITLIPMVIISLIDVFKYAFL